LSGLNLSSAGIRFYKVSGVGATHIDSGSEPKKAKQLALLIAPFVGIRFRSYIDFGFAT